MPWNCCTHILGTKYLDLEWSVVFSVANGLIIVLGPPHPRFLFGGFCLKTGAFSVKLVAPTGGAADDDGTCKIVKLKYTL